MPLVPTSTTSTSTATATSLIWSALWCLKKRLWENIWRTTTLRLKEHSKNSVRVKKSKRLFSRNWKKSMNILQYGGFWGCVWNDSSWCPSRRWRISTLVLKYGPLRTICWPPPWNWREKLVRRNTRYESVRYVVIVRYRAALSNCTRKECILFKELEHSCWSMKLLCFPWFCKNFLFSKKNFMQLCVTIKLRVSFVEKRDWKRKKRNMVQVSLVFTSFWVGGRSMRIKKYVKNGHTWTIFRFLWLFALD